MKKSDKELLSELLEIPEQEMRGNSIPDLLDSIPDERVDLVREIAARYKGYRHKRLYCVSWYIYL